MPKLVRLTTENNDGIFDCDFNEDFILEPQSSVALHSFTTQFPFTEITIDSTNNEIKYTVDGTPFEKIVVLEQATYNNANIQSLFQSTTTLFNESMGSSTNEIHKQFFCALNGGRVIFKVATARSGYSYVGPIINIRASRSKNVVENTSPSSPSTFQRSGGTITTDDSFLYWLAPVSKGSSFLRTQFLSDPTPGDGGFVCGYLYNSPTSNTTVIDATNIAFGIRFVRATDPYKYIVNGVSTVAPGIFPEVNDTISIDIAEGVLKLNIRRAAGAVVTLHTNTYNHITNLFPVTIFVGDTILGRTLFGVDPFYLDSTDLTDTEEEEELGGLEFKRAVTNNYLQFLSPSLASTLGFDNARIPRTGFTRAINVDYQARNRFILRDVSESYIIELLNINLDSMDAQSKQRRNFLAVVPQVSQIREHVVYVTPTLIFLDLNNQYRQNYRQIRARILKDDLTPVITYGASQMTLIVQNGRL
jgi:hypothetical protein